MMKIIFWSVVAFLALVHTMAGGSFWGLAIFLVLVPIIAVRFLVTVGQFTLGFSKLGPEFCAVFKRKAGAHSHKNVKRKKTRQKFLRLQSIMREY